MKKKSQTAMLLLLTVIAVGPVWAQQSKIYREGSSWVEEITGTLPAARSLRVTAAMGAVRVEGGDRSDVAYMVKKRSYAGSEDAARSEFERFRVSASRSGDTAVIQGDSEGHAFRRFSAEFTINVPRSLEAVKVGTKGGSVSARNVAGRVELVSGGGGVSLANIGGPVTATSGGGGIELNGANSDVALRTGGGGIRIVSSKGRVEAQTGGGSIEVVSAAQAVVAHTGGGNIDVRECQGDLDATTGGGQVETGQVGGRAVIRTGGGSIHLSGAKGPVEISTGGGNIELLNLTQGATASTGAGSITAEFVGSGLSGSSLSTSGGDVIVYFSPGVKVNVDAAVDMANGHHIRSDFPELKVTSQGGEYGPQMITAEGRLNGGGATLRVRTTSGDIEFRRAKQ